MTTAVSPEVRRKLVTRGREDPNWWIRTVLGRRQWSKQDRIVESVRDHESTSVASGNSQGKTYVAADVVLWFLYNHRPSIVLTTAPTGRQVPKLLWKEIGVAHGSALYPLGGRLLTQELKLANNWFAMGFTTSHTKPDAFAGFHEAHILVVVDESCGVDQAIHDGIDGILASGHARLLQIGNPLDRNTPFGQSFRQPSVRKFRLGAFESPNFTTFGITLADIRSGEWQKKIDGQPLPFPQLVSPAWVRGKLEKWGEKSPSFTARVLGRFPDSSVDALFPGELIRLAQALILTPRETTPRIIGVDVARYGDDETVFMLRHGGRARCIYRSLDTKPNPMTTAGRVIFAAREHGASKIYVDATGVGGPLVDRLRELDLPGIQVEGVNFGAAPLDKERFADVRAECFWNVRERMTQGELDIDGEDQDLEAELSVLKTAFTSGGKIRIESKDAMRKRGIPSPNIADALAVSFADAFEPAPAQVW